MGWQGAPDKTTGRTCGLQLPKGVALPVACWRCRRISQVDEGRGGLARRAHLRAAGAAWDPLTGHIHSKGLITITMGRHCILREVTVRGMLEDVLLFRVL